MSNPHIEVARTYFRRAIGSWMAMLWIAVGLIQVLVSLVNPRSVADSSGLLVLMGIVFLGALLWLQFREYAANERARLVPGYAAPHIVVFAILTFLLTIAWPVGITLRGGSQSVGLMACLMVVMAYFGWWLLMMSWPLTLLGIFAWVGMMTKNGQDHLAPLLSGEHEAAAWAIFVAGLLAIVGAMVRMIRLTEDDAIYHRRPQFGAWSLRPQMTGDASRAWAETQKQNFFINWFGRRSMILAPPGASLWTCAQRWRRQTGVNPAMAILIGGSMLVGARLTSRDYTAPTMALYAFLLFMPSMMTASAWLRMWRYLESESLRPIARARFIRELGLAMAIDVLTLWFGFAVVIVTDAALFGPPPFDWRLLAARIGMSLLIQTLGFGVVAWTVRHRSPVHMAFATMAAMVVPAVLVLLMSDPLPHSWQINALIAIAVLGCACIGMAVIRAAYRRWLVTELG